MFNPSYLQLSDDGVFYLRWPIPRCFHPAKKASTLRLSLRTRDRRIALRLSHLAGQIADNVIAAGSAHGMRYDEVRALLKDHFQQLLKHRVESINRTGPLSVLDRQTFQNSVLLAEESIAGPHGITIDDSSDSELLSRFIEKYRLVVEAGTEPYKWLHSELKKSYRDYAKAVLDHDSALNSYDFQAGPSASRDTAISLEALPAAGMTIAELGRAYQQEKTRAERWMPKTTSEKKEHISLLEEILGANTDITRLLAKDAKTVKDTIFLYPKNRSKNPLTRGKPLGSILNIVGTEKLHLTTVNKYIQTYNDMFEWAKRNSHTEVNLFAGLTVQKGKGRSNTARQPFSDEQMALILNALTDTGNTIIRKPYQKWGPLIGAYSGARLNEISQLHLIDIRQEGDIWCFDLNDDGDSKHLKAAASKRLVPIHPKLIQLGLLDYVQELKQAGKSKLFPDFSYCPKNGWGRSLGRWFNEVLLTDLNIKNKSLVFHSLRHTVVTRLMRANVPEPIVKSIIGHAQEGVTQNSYFRQGYSMPQIADGLKNLIY